MQFNITNRSLLLYCIIVTLLGFNSNVVGQIKITIPYYDVVNASAPANPNIGNTRVYIDTSNIVHTLSSSGTNNSLLCTTCSGASLTGLGGDLSGTNLGTAIVSTVGGASSTNIADAVTKRHSQNTDTGTTQTTFTINSGGSQLIFTSSGQTGNHTVTFPNSTGTVLYNNGDGSSLTNIVTSVNTRTGAVTGLEDVLDKVGSTGNTTADTTEQQAYSFPLPASSLSATGALDLKFLLYMRNGTGSTSTWVVKVKFGATTLVTSPSLSGQGTGGSTLRGDIHIGATGGTSTQAYSGILYWTAAADSTTASATNTYQASNTSGLNLNNSNNVVVTVTETLATGAVHGSFNMRSADTIVVK